MTRKEFIEKGLALGISLPFLSLLFESCTDDRLEYPEFEVNFTGKIIVVGAGAAGLIAGYILAKYNIDFQIVEASSFFGGRVKRANNFADFPIDLGAEWIHEDPSVLARLIQDPQVNANLDVITYNPATIYNWHNGRLKKQNWGSNFYSEYKFKNSTWYGFFEQMIVPAIGNNITYKSPVTEIDYSGSQVQLTTSGGDTYLADKVLVTVPIKILQEGSIDFKPDLPAAKKSAIDSVEMPDGIKVFVEFSEQFYPDILFTGALISEMQASDKLYYNAAFGKDTDRHVLGLFTVGEKAAAYAGLNSDAEIISKVLAELDEIFDGQASEKYVKHIIQNWSKEPYIQGSYSYTYSQSEELTIPTLLEPINDKIYFAGEALSLDNGSTVPGAGESAYAVVETMLK